MKEDLILILVIGIIIPILFTPIIIDAVQPDYDSGIVVEFTYPKNFSNLKPDIEDHLTELFASDKPTITDSALIEFFASDKPILTDSILIETFDNEQSTLEFDTQVSILITDKTEVVEDEQY